MRPKTSKSTSAQEDGRQRTEDRGQRKFLISDFWLLTFDSLKPIVLQKTVVAKKKPEQVSLRVLRFEIIESPKPAIRSGLFAYAEVLEYPLQYPLVDVLMLDIRQSLAGGPQHYCGNFIVAGL